MAGDGLKIYKVGSKADGDDFDKAEIELLIYKIAEWFKSDKCDRTYSDPMEAAEQKVRECLLAETAAGASWRGAPASFEARIKSKTLFDMETGEGVYSPRVKSPRALKKVDPDAENAAASLSGDLNFDEDTYREEREREIKQAHPELDNPANEPNVKRLSLLFAQQELLDRQLALMNSYSKKKADMLATLETIQKMSDNTMKSLGIHPDQIRKRIDGQEKGTIGDLVALIEGDEDFRKRNKQWMLTMALQLYWMSVPHDVGPRSGRKSGPQLHPFEIWHMTRTRPMEFTCRVCNEHYPALVDGFEPQELYEYLVSEGVLVEEPVIPQLINKEDLDGMVEYFEGDGEQEEVVDGE